MKTLTTTAPGKVNLCLFIGEKREDGLHELVSVIQPVSLADELTLEVDPPGIERDEVVCEKVKGKNLAAQAISLYRQATDSELPPVRLTIKKSIPIAAGMAGGSADAAAALKLMARADGRPCDPILNELAPELGSDVLAMLHGGRVLVSGAGEVVEPLASSNTEEQYGLLVLQADAYLSTGAVYTESERMNTPRASSNLNLLAKTLRQVAQEGALPPAGLIQNDLTEPARYLCPEITTRMSQVRALGANHTLVSGSGPTVFGIFTGANGQVRARQAAESLKAEGDTAHAVTPLT